MAIRSRKENDSLNLTESEIRSIIKSEVQRLNEGSNDGSQLTYVIGDAMLDGLRSIVNSAVKNSDVRKIAKSAVKEDKKTFAKDIVETLLNDPDFKTDLVSLVSLMIKRASIL